MDKWTPLGGGFPRNSESHSACSVPTEYSILLPPPPPPPPSHALISSLSTVNRKLVARNLEYSVGNGFLPLPPSPLQGGESKERASLNS